MTLEQRLDHIERELTVITEALRLHSLLLESLTRDKKEGETR